MVGLENPSICIREDTTIRILIFQLILGCSGLGDSRHGWKKMEILVKSPKRQLIKLNLVSWFAQMIGKIFEKNYKWTYGEK